MEGKGPYIFFSILVIWIVAANIPACNPPGGGVSTDRQAIQICEDVYKGSDDYIGYSECVEKANRSLKNMQ